MRTQVRVFLYIPFHTLCTRLLCEGHIIKIMCTKSRAIKSKMVICGVSFIMGKIIIDRYKGSVGKPIIGAYS